MSPLRLPAFFNGATSSRYILSVLSSDTYQQRFNVTIRLRNDRALLHKPIHVISCEEETGNGEGCRKDMRQQPPNGERLPVQVAWSRRRTSLLGQPQQGLSAT